MVVYNTDLDPTLSQDQVDTIVNNLILDMSEFSRIACMDGRAFGVITSCDTCDIEINTCLREHIIQKLVSSQETAELILNYDVTPRYKSVRKLWDGCSRIRLDCGLSELGVERTFGGVTYPTVTEAISYPLISDVPTTDSGSGYCTATLDGTIVKNPNEIVFRNRSTNEVIPTQTVPGFPVKIAGDWVVALGNQELPPCSTTIDAYHCNLVRVVTPVTAVSDGFIAPVFPGTNQIIPQALPSELINGGVDRVYWFYVWEFLEHAFRHEGADLEAGEYYKLMETIDFVAVRETACEILVEYSEWSTTTPGDVTITTAAAVGHTIIDAKTGVVEIYPNPDEICSGCQKRITAVTICYKTDPVILGFDSHVTEIKDAIAHLTAAELPLTVCDCHIQKGFIKKAQEAYTETRINPITGEAIMNLKHGNLYGQLVFSEKIDRLIKVPRITYL